MNETIDRAILRMEGEQTFPDEMREWADSKYGKNIELYQMTYMNTPKIGSTALIKSNELTANYDLMIGTNQGNVLYQQKIRGE